MSTFAAPATATTATDPAAEPLSGPAPAPVTAAAPLLAPAKPERLLSLDVLRGITVAGMILVNNPGSWNHLYDPPLEHSPWDGCTPTDLVFPFFLFMVGVAMTFSFDRRLARGASRAKLFGHVAARSAVLVLLSWSLSSFPNLRLLIPFVLMIAGCQLVTREEGSRLSIRAGWLSLVAGLAWWLIDFRYFNGPTARGSFKDYFPLAPTGGGVLRVTGVLSRIGVCYLLASAIALNTRPKGRAVWAALILFGYWAVMVFCHAPAGYHITNGYEHAHVDSPAGVPFPGALNDWIDVRLLGRHLYSARPDPEGLLSSFPAVATVLIGTLIGTWLLRANMDRARKCVGMAIAGVILVVLGRVWNVEFPINKKLWTSSYVLYTAGLASLLLALCYYLCDILHWRRWGIPFIILGTNAIVAFWGSGLMSRLFSMIKWGPTENPTTIHGWTYSFFEHAFHDPRNASLGWALCFVAVWVLLLWPLYYKRIFIRV